MCVFATPMCCTIIGFQVLDLHAVSRPCVMPGAIPSSLHAYMSLRYMPRTGYRECADVITSTMHSSTSVNGSPLATTITLASSELQQQQCLRRLNSPLPPLAVLELYGVAVANLARYKTTPDDDEMMLRLNGKGIGCRAQVQHKHAVEEGSASGDTSSDNASEEDSFGFRMCLELSLAEEYGTVLVCQWEPPVACEHCLNLF
jgi:hypothetical protein